MGTAAAAAPAVLAHDTASAITVARPAFLVDSELEIRSVRRQRPTLWPPASLLREEPTTPGLVD